jgi:GTP-binding nuclear protein Ran
MLHQNNKTLRIVVDSNKQHLENKETIQTTTNLDFVKYALLYYRQPCGEEYTSFHELFINYSIKINDIESLKVLYDSHIFHINYHAGIILHFLKSANTNMLKYFYEKSSKKMMSCLYPQFTQCINGNTTPVQQLTCLKYLISIGCKLHGKIDRNIIKYSNIEVIEFLLNNGYHIDTTRNQYWACFEGKIEMLKYFVEKGCKLNYNCPNAAAINEHLHIIKYLHENNCPGLEYALNGATEHNNLDIIKYLVENGYKFTNSQPLINAALNQNLKIMNYLHKNGCEWSPRVTSTAADQGSLECLRYAHKNGCTWYSNTINNAARSRPYNLSYNSDRKYDHIGCLKYAVDNGCPFDQNSFKIAIRKDLTALKYLYKKGCPFIPDDVKAYLEHEGESLRLGHEVHDYVNKIVAEKKALEPKKKRILIVGDGGVGKSTFLKRYRTGEFTTQYIPTQGHLEYQLNKPHEILTVIDTSGQEKYSPITIENVDGIIIMFDVTSKISYYNVPQWYATMRKLYGKDVPVILCGNKVDRVDRKITCNMITYHREYNMKYYDISAKSNYNYEKPFDTLSKSIKK